MTARTAALPVAAVRRFPPAYWTQPAYVLHEHFDPTGGGNLYQPETKHGKMLFDYIVVGTGPAGAVIAKTLTDDKRTSVLLLEAGENHDLDTAIRDSTMAAELEERFFAEYFWQGEEPRLFSRG